MGLNKDKDNSPGVRINKYISESGFCSRREADKFIETRKVTINGRIAETGSKVNEGDIVKVNGKKIVNERPRIYLALNKPVGITCTTERNVRGNIVDFIGHRERIFPIGRLDKDSEGLIFLTNDGDIVNKILRAGNNHEKEYVVTVDKPINREFLKAMSSGVRILGTMTLPCKINQEGKNTFRIILVEGKNRQIRRMCEALGYEVKKLKRVRIMNVTLGNLPTGYWRYLTEKEMDTINNLVKESSKTDEASSEVSEYQE